MKISEVFDNIGIKLVCLLLAIVMWLYATKGLQITRQDEPRPITFSEVPIQLMGLPQGQWKPNPEAVSLEVECSTIEIAIDSLRAVVNLVPEDGVKRQVVLTEKNVKLPEGMNFVKADPDKIELVQ